MKKFHFPLILLMLSLPFKAISSSCQESCFSKKNSCNQSQGHTFNSCGTDLFACKASCNSGKAHGTYQKVSLPFQVSVKPILKLNR